MLKLPFFIRGKTCARIRSHIAALGSNTGDIGVLLLPAVLFFTRPDPISGFRYTRGAVLSVVQPRDEINFRS